MTTDPSHSIIRKQVQSVQFGYYTDDDVRCRSVVEITSPISFDPITQLPLSNGLYDMKMGPIPGMNMGGGIGGGISSVSSCITCGRTVRDCTGHYGHVELIVPIYHPILLLDLLQIIQCICRNCYQYRCTKQYIYIIQMKLLLLQQYEYHNIVLQEQQQQSSSSSNSNSSSSNTSISPMKYDYHMFDTQVAAALYEVRENVGNHDNSNTNTTKAASTRAANQKIEQMYYEIRTSTKVMKQQLMKLYPSSLSLLKSSKSSSYIQQLYNELSKSTISYCMSINKCHHCGIYSPKIRLDTSYNKLFQCPLPKKYQIYNNQISSNNNKNKISGKYIFPSCAQLLPPIHDTPKNDQQQGDESHDVSLSSSIRNNNTTTTNYDSDDTAMSDENDDDVDDDGDDDDDDEEEENEDDDNNKQTTVSNTQRNRNTIQTQNDIDNDDDDDDDEEERITITSSSSSSKQRKKERDMYLPPTEVMGLLQRLYYNYHDTQLCQQLTGCQSYKNYFLSCISILPNRFRPPMKVNDTTVEHVQTAFYQQILLHNATLRDQIAILSNNNTSTNNNNNATVDVVTLNNTNNNKVTNNAYQTWIELQTAVNCYMDSSKDPKKTASNNVSAGIRQILERKEGLFRKHMMGKRVNYACRSVISPDPYIGSNEIGLPKYFCTILTYPTYVTPNNLRSMRNAVLRGPNHYPGARWVQLSNSTHKVDLSKMRYHQRRAIAAQLSNTNTNNNNHSSTSPTIVGRQLQDGDYVLMNRQPTLHKPGIMAHRVRVLHNPTQKTIRMHYANCNTYNADFDGDEMNCHYPQNDLARVEAQYLAQTDLQYIVPTDGSPLRGLIQDHVVGGVKMTKKDTFFKKWEYQQLLFAALSSLPGLEVIRHNDKIEMVPPAILKPVQLWTGKQVITSILLHLRKGSDRDSAKLSNLPGLSMERQSKTPDSSFGVEQEEHIVLIRDGELLRGVLDKNAFGATNFSLVHCVYEAYGPEKAGLLLNVFGRLFTAYLQYYSGHSCRMEDLVLRPDADAERRILIQRAYNLGARAAKAWADSEGGKVTIPSIKDQPGAEKPLKMGEVSSAATKIGLLLSGNEGKDNFAALDGFMQGQLNPLASDIIKKTLPIGLAVPFPHNTFGIMTTTGAKGSIVNQSQVSCALGQQALEGRRVPRMSSGRTLPSFAPYDPNPRADGFVMDRFLTGIRPQEYYFHCMAGREGLVDTAVKTSRSGYLQRCLIKHLEELKICYDFTVRNSDGNVVQFLYGEDGLDPTKASYLDCSTKSFEFLARNHDSLKRNNSALPSSSIEIAANDFFRSKDLENGDMRSFAVGDPVLARRLRYGQQWTRGALCHGWSFATITKIHARGETLDLRYHNDGQIVQRVPVEADLGTAGGKQTMALSSKTILVKACTLDPVISSPSRGHLLGSSGTCVSEQVAGAAAKAMTTSLAGIIKSLNISKQDLSSLIGAKYSSSICAPGEAVGSIAAQSVGEPSTQMTLNTFHLAGAGANVTLGIPRLREIIMTASRTLKTPTLSVPLNDSVTEKEAIRLARVFKKLTLLDLISGKQGVSVTERLEKSDSGRWLRAYYVTLKFHPAERIMEAFGLSLQDIAVVVSKNYVPLLSQIMKKELKRSAVDDDGNIGEVAGGTSTEYMEDAENSPDTPNIVSDVDDLNEDDKEDEDLDDIAGEEDGVEFGRKRNDSYDDEDNDQESDEDDMDDNGRTNEVEQAPLQSEDKLNVNDAPTIQKRSNSIALQALKVEPSARPLLMVDLVEKAASTILVRARKNIEEAYINEEPKRGRCLQTAGINFEEIWELDTVKHDELICNDIWAIRCAYGVEAARDSIMGQIRGVFGAYGIEVDPRHLSLIADYMTFDGGFKPMSRIGMEDCASTLLQMSFETTAHFLKKAASATKVDNMESPSANIVLGKPIRHGTGNFSLLSKS